MDEFRLVSRAESMESLDGENQRTLELAAIPIVELALSIV